MSQEVLAVVAGEEITQAEFDAFLQGVPREQQPYLSNPQFREQCLEQLIALHMFAKNGEEMKLEETEEFKKLVEDEAGRDRRISGDGRKCQERYPCTDGYERDFERCCGIGRRNRSLL